MKVYVFCIFPFLDRVYYLTIERVGRIRDLNISDGAAFYLHTV